MTPDELIDLSTRAAEQANRVALQALAGQIDAAERIAARQVSDALARAGVEILRDPNAGAAPT